MRATDSREFEHIRETLFELLDKKRIKLLRQTLEEMNEFDVAEFLSEIEPAKMAMIFRMLSKEKGAEVFANLDVGEQEFIINSVSDTELGDIIEELYVDDAVDMMEELPANVVKRVMRAATPDTRSIINQYLNYPENSAGGIMTAEFIDLKKYMNVKESIARIRRIGEDKETIYTCFVTSSDRRLEGVVTVKELLLANDDDVIEDIMDRNLIYVSTTDDRETVTEKFSDYDLLALPVADSEGRLVGIVTVDDVIDVLEQEATEDIEKMAAITPSDKPYLKLGVFEIWKNRIPWLMLLMVSATFTGIIITSFEDALAVQAVLMAFIPMLMDTGGNSGSQASVTVIRSISLGDIEFSDIMEVIWKEIRVAVLSGVALACATFAKILLVDKLIMGNPEVSFLVSLVVCITMALTVFCAKFVGCTLPMLAKKAGFDPAVMSSPFITTIVDAISLLIYFSVAKILLHI
ncbi:MAG: magnesium transporter [Oscillospiraceae bacterium]|nr:magnesium transporter [Oscillospiraceae bacterium]